MSSKKKKEVHPRVTIYSRIIGIANKAVFNAACKASLF